METIKVYFGDLPLIFTNDADGFTTGRHASTATEALTMVKSGIDDENREPIVFVTEDVSTEKEEIFKDYEFIQAGGGLVRNTENTYLIIYRRGHWDLPKGKWDEGETIEECALREVNEETGLSELTIVKPLPPSYHVYKQNGIDILKKTHWYLMYHEGDSQLQLQTEEDIEEGKWVSPNEMENYFAEMYPLIRDLIETSIE